MEKKILIIFTALGINYMNAQSFERGNVVIEAGVKLGVYNTKGKDAYLGTEQTGKAASYLIPLSFECGLTQRIGLGGQITLSNYISKEDSTTKTTPNANSVDIAMNANLHILRRGKVDLYTGFTFGFSSFNYKEHKVTNLVYTAKGGILNWNLGTRIYISKHVGVGINLALANYNYSKGKVTDSSGNNFDYSLKAVGTNWGLGLALKF